MFIYKPHVFTFPRKVVKYTSASFSLPWPTSWLLTFQLLVITTNQNIKIALTEEAKPELQYVGRASSRPDQYKLAPGAWSRKYTTGLLITIRAG